MDFIFIFNGKRQAEILKGSGLEKGVCATACLAFSINELNGFNLSMNEAKYRQYYAETTRFMGRHRAYHYAVEAGKIKGYEIIRHSDEVEVESGWATRFWNELMLLKPGIHIIIIRLRTGDCHAVALSKRKEGWVFFDPAKGMYKCGDTPRDAIEYMMENYSLDFLLVFKIKRK